MSRNGNDRRILSGVALLVLPLALAVAAQGRPQTPWTKTLEAIDRAVATSKVPGLAVAVTDREKTLGVFTHGYADLKTQKPITADSLFEIGSISKSFTAIAMMQLADEGRFDPQAPIATYLPWFEIKSPFGPITGHHVLTHTAGLPNYRADLASMPFAVYSLRDFEPSYAPGAHFWYSNLGYQMLGYALERIEGAPYPSIIQRRIFDRVGMRSSVAAIDDRLRAKLPVSYERWPFTNEFVEEPWFEYSAADGSVVSTAADMAAYARVLLNRGAVPQGRLLSERAFDQLTMPALENYAYGLRVRTVDGDTEIQHSGSIAGFGSVLAVRMDDGFGVVMLGTAGIDVAVGQWIVSAMRATVRNQPVSELKAPPAAPVDAWAGTYVARDRRVLEFSVDSSDRARLMLKRGERQVPLTRVGADAFRASDEEATEFPYTFERGDGKVVAVAHGSDWYTRGTYTGPASFDVPPEYAAYAGRYKNHNPEDGPLRVFIRGGSLMIAGGVNDGGRKLVRVGAATFRPETPDYNPERYVFDSIVEGRALRVLVSGMPMYRVE
ncbi:MAG TPA: serine hydrolase domain-containing protein [Vicinamibacterales bacterium]|nr:serine hydrolase domain-containing protein [Vicinamibacterales bacterium]